MLERANPRRPKCPFCCSRLPNRGADLRLARSIKSGLLAAHPDATVGPHAFRKAYGNHCYPNGIELRALQMLLGNTALDSTMVYVDCQLPDWQEDYQKYHPWRT